MTKKIFCTNWHTHTPFCEHAAGSCAEFCRQLPESIRRLGFADHIPYPDGRYFTGDHYQHMDEYFRYLEKGRQMYPGIEIIAGFEAEWCPELGRDFYEEHYFSRGIRYLIGSAHYSAFNDAHFYTYDASDAAVVKGFVDKTVATMESGIFLYIAHPDAYLKQIRDLNDNLKSGFIDIIQAAKDLDIPLELNCNGLRNGHQYPAMLFWELAAEYGVRTVIGSDAHYPEALYDEFWHKGMQMLSALGLPPCNEELDKRIR